MKLHSILDLAISYDASDINITSDDQLAMRVNRDILILKQVEYYISIYDIQDICNELSGSDSVLVDLYTPLEKDGSYTYSILDSNHLPKTYYFRFNIALSGGSIHITIRKLIDSIMPINKLMLDSGPGKEFLDACMMLKEGLNICVGATGSGKSTTLATIIHEQLLSKPIKTVTLESPIEYYFPKKDYMANNSIIIQREIPTDSPSFLMGLRAAMRQNPDVIFVGEIRDAETAQAAMQAANTGHTVMATLHASSAAMAYDRLKYLVGDVTNDYSFITSIMFQKLIKENGKVLPVRETIVNI